MEETRSWRDRWIWLLLAVCALVFVVIAAGSWWSTESNKDSTTSDYVCAISPDDC